MKRLVLILLGLVLGLALAALSEGRLTHLRSAAPGLVPGWLAGAEDHSSLWRGQRRGLQMRPWPVAGDVTWRCCRVTTR